MGFLGDIKKLLFGAKAVTKSAADKAADYTKEKGGDLLDSADDLLDKAKDKASDLGSTVMEKGGELWETAKDKVSDLTGSDDEPSTKIADEIPDFDAKAIDDSPSAIENIGGKVMETGKNIANKAGEVAENVGGKIMDASAPYVEKAGEVAENVGGVILEKGGDVLDKGKDISEKVGGKILDAAGDLMDKAKDFGSTMMDKTNDLIEKANEAAAKESLDDQIDEAKSWNEKLADHVKGKDVLDQKDPPIGYEKLDKSLLDDKDSFWAKAEKFADGNYSGEEKKDAPPAAENDIFANTAERQKQIEQPDEKEPFKGDIKGYKDNDGDGDPLIDDAILDEDDDNDK